MKEILIDLLDILGMTFWVEINTAEPRCTYYFGPFLTKKEAEVAQYGYIEDLQAEGAKGIIADVRRCKPKELTIFDEQEEEVVNFASVSLD
ncbi:MAG: DUF1816 domain-containing protein [Cyanobacteria bacterium J083]|nr:MAG: DUF1816 domain-containing protein [Cyanobacteria bacterium J083]